MSSTTTETTALPLSSIRSTPTVPALSAYSVSSTYGFLPPSPPLTSLPSNFQPWDALATSLPALLTSNNPTQLRQQVHTLPLLSASSLISPAELRRAFVVLGFTIHGYVWADFENPEPVVPPCLAVPYLDICGRLGMQPTLSYAGLCLWNWEKRNGAVEGSWELGDLKCLVSFTATEDEAAFYLVPVIVEVEGAKVVALLADALKVAVEKPKDGVEEVMRALVRGGEILRKLGGFLRLLHERCDPHVFYHQVRPFLQGGKGMEEKGLPRGFVFQMSESVEICLKCVGGSAAQSGLFHFIDLALGVVHKPLGDADGETMFDEMRSYMPEEHRAFLKAISTLPSLRSYVEAHSNNDRLSSAYNGCLKELSAWRSRHIGVVTTHIITPARKAQAQSQRQSVSQVKDRLSTTDESKLQGTGGSALIPFLKQAKEETINSCV